jgi:hypothetical protein
VFCREAISSPISNKRLTHDPKPRYQRCLSGQVPGFEIPVKGDPFCFDETIDER